MVGEEQDLVSKTLIGTCDNRLCHLRSTAHASRGRRNAVNRYVGSVFSALVLLACIHAQESPVAQPRQAWTEHYRRATISLGRLITVDGKQAFDVIGTGVMVCTDNTHPFLVTAKHVFYEPEKNWNPTGLRVRFSNQERASFTEELGSELQLMNASNQRLWSGLPDGSDIAAIPAPGSFRGHLTDCVGLQDFADEDEIYDGATVFTFGFPKDSSVLTGQNGLVRAITRSGIIAWTDPNGAEDNPLLLDSNVLPGNSGGPAFRVPTGLNKWGTLVVGARVSFLGIVTSALIEAVQVAGQPLKFQTNPLTPPDQVGVPGVGALGRVEPAAKIRKLVMSLAAHP